MVKKEKRPQDRVPSWGLKKDEGKEEGGTR